MTKSHTLFFTFMLISFLSSCKGGFKPLFDGETLHGWTTARSSGEGDYGPFSVNKEEKAIHVYAGQEDESEQLSDVLYTDKEYSHFILKLEYKWLEKKFSPRIDWDRDSGLLFHIHGDLTQVWPYCIEMQIGESPANKPNKRGAEGRFHSGDLFVIGKGLSTETRRNKNKYYEPTQEPMRGRSVFATSGTEKKGEWNQMELHVYGDKKAVFILNDEVVLETANFEYNGNPIGKGRIGLQAEWAEILFRNIEIKELPIE